MFDHLTFFVWSWLLGSLLLCYYYIVDGLCIAIAFGVLRLFSFFLFLFYIWLYNGIYYKHKDAWYAAKLITKSRRNINSHTTHIKHINLYNLAPRQFFTSKWSMRMHTTQTRGHRHTKEQNVDYKAKHKGRAHRHRIEISHCAHCTGCVQCADIIKHQHTSKMYLLTLIKATKKCMF